MFAGEAILAPILGAEASIPVFGEVAMGLTLGITGLVKMSKNIRRNR